MRQKFLLIYLLIFTFFLYIPLDAAPDGISIILKNKTGSPEELKVYNRSFGLVIGIDKYASLGPDKQLSYCVKDAKGVKGVLEERYSFTKIESLFDREATRDGILKKFADMQSGYKIGEGDALFVFIASHGITFGDLGYIVPQDGSFAESEYYKNISMLNLKDEVGKLVKAKHIFYVIDACYSGTILESRGDAIRKSDDAFAYIREVAKEMVRYALTAGDKGQTVLDGGPKGHSVFTGRFIEALEEADGFITAPELSSKIARKVFSDAKDRGHVQSPKHGYLSGMGEFVFITKAGNSLLSVENELAKIEKEKKEIDEKIKRAKSKEEKDRLDLELQKKRAEEEKKRLEQEKLSELEARKAEGRKRLREIQEEHNKNRMNQEEGLAKIEKANEEKRKALDELSRIENTGESAIRQIMEMEKMIAEIKSSYDSARKKALEGVKSFYKERYDAVKSIKKDPWEKQAEFHERKKSELETYTKNEYEETSTLNKRYDEEIAKNTKELNEKVNVLRNKKYKLFGKDVKVELGELDSEREVFPITVTSIVKQLPWREKLEYSIKSSNAKERKEKYQKVVNTAKAGGYAGEFLYVIRYDEKAKTYKPILWEAKVIELGGNSVEIATKWTKYREEGETQKKKFETMLLKTHITMRPLLFSPDNDGFNDELTIGLKVEDHSLVESWSIQIMDPLGHTFYSLLGTGAPPSMFKWDGLSDDGIIVESATYYPISFTATDAFGNNVAIKNIVPIDILIMKVGNNYKIRIPSITFKPFTDDYINVDSEKLQVNMNTLKRLAEIVKKYSSYGIRIEGYSLSLYWADPVKARIEQAQDLIPLSKKRADAIKKGLVALGIEAARIETAGLGAIDPIVPHGDQENNWKNRRLEFILIPWK